MKKLFFTLLVFATAFCFAQGPKPDITKLPTTDEVNLTINGLTLENTISQEKIIAAKTWDLKGDHAAKYKIAYYQFKTSYDHTFSNNDEFFNNEVTPVMTQFFTDLEKNCKIMFDDVVVQNIETGKQYKIAPLTVVVKMQ
jgi:hypothetical protein